MNMKKKYEILSRNTILSPDDPTKNVFIMKDKQMGLLDFLNHKVSLLMFFIFAISNTSYAQNYTFAQSSGTYTTVPSPTTVHASGWDEAVVAATIPFNFTYNGSVYTTCNVATNGFITLGTTAPAGNYYTPISGSTGYDLAVSAFGRDLISNASTIVKGVSGSSPNRIFIIQWNNAQRYNGGAVAGDVLNFQIRLYETSNKIEIMYGSCSATSTANSSKGEVGLRGTSNATFNNRSGANNTAWASTSAGTTNADTVNYKSTVLPASGLTFTWTPIPPPANDNCSGATGLTVGAAAVTGNVSGATQSLAATCAGTANDDIWYSFTTSTAGTYAITLVGSSSFDAVLDLRSGACNGTNIACADNTSGGGTETITATGLAASTTYYIRAYDYYSTIPATTTFTIAVAFIPPPTITSFASSGCAGSSLVITGTNLSGASSVTIGGTTAAITANTATSVTVTVGSGTTGNIVITATNGTVTSATPFTVNPLPTTTWSSATSPVCFSASAQTTPLAYTATTNSPSTYSITWNASPDRKSVV